MNEQEEKLIFQLKCGNESAYKHIFDHYYVTLCRVATVYVDDPFVAQNLVGDLLLYLWQKREQVEIHTSLRSYLLTAIRRRSINYMREAHVMRESSISDQIASTIITTAETNPLGQLIEKELEEKINFCVDQLPEECRTVFKMSRYEQLSYDAIAQKLGISKNTVGYHVSKALAALRVQLIDYLPALIVFWFKH